MGQYVPWGARRNYPFVYVLLAIATISSTMIAKLGQLIAVCLTSMLPPNSNEFAINNLAGSRPD